MRCTVRLTLAHLTTPSPLSTPSVLPASPRLDSAQKRRPEKARDGTCDVVCVVFFLSTRADVPVLCACACACAAVQSKAGQGNRPSFHPSIHPASQPSHSNERATMEHAQHKNAPGSSSSRPSTTTTTTTSASAGSLAQYRPSAAAQDKLALCVARALRLKHSAPSSSSSSASPTAAAAAGAVRRPATRRSTLANWVDADSHEQGQGQHARGERYDEDDDDDDDDELAGRLMLATHESTSPVELAQGPYPCVDPPSVPAAALTTSEPLGQVHSRS